MNSQARKQNGAIFFPANGPSLIDKIYFEKHAIPYEYPVATTVVRKKKKQEEMNRALAVVGKNLRSVASKKVFTINLITL